MMVSTLAPVEVRGMATSLHAALYRPVPPLLKAMREEAGLTTRELAANVRRPQSWVYKCENAERRVDVAEFCLWCKGCDVDPAAGIRRLLGVEHEAKPVKPRRRKA